MESRNPLIYHIGTTSLILVFALILFQPVLHWFFTLMAANNGSLYFWLFITATVAAAIWFFLNPDFQLRPALFFHPGLPIWIAAVIAYLLNEYWLGFHSLSLALMLLFGLGLMRSFISAQQWRKLLLPTLLMVLVLPFDHYLDIYLGFPLRLFSANAAETLLREVGIAVVGSDTILAIDNKAALVDLDCSGVKSLWIGMIFFLLLTWVERLRLSLGWLLCGLAFFTMLVAANIIRITILVLLELHWQMPQLANAMHQFLGLFGFALAAVITWGLIRLLLKHQSASPQPQEQTWSGSPSQGLVITVLLAIAVLLYQPLQEFPELAQQQRPQLSGIIDAKLITLSDQEKNFYGKQDSQAWKYAFSVEHRGNTYKGSLVLVLSSSWRNHHLPENCYLSQGFNITAKSHLQTGPDALIKALQITAPQNLNHSLEPLQAYYWFQSSRQLTADFTHRAIQGLINPQQPWLLVSILWNQPVANDLSLPLIKQLQTTLTKEVKHVS